MVSAIGSTPAASVQSSWSGDGVLTLAFTGRLDAHTIARNRGVELTKVFNG